MWIIILFRPQVSEKSDDNASVRIRVNSPPEPENEHLRLGRSKISYYSSKYNFHINGAIFNNYYAH